MSGQGLRVDSFRNILQWSDPLLVAVCGEGWMDAGLGRWVGGDWVRWEGAGSKDNGRKISFRSIAKRILRPVDGLRGPFRNISETGPMATHTTNSTPLFRIVLKGPQKGQQNTPSGQALARQPKRPHNRSACQAPSPASPSGLITDQLAKNLGQDPEQAHNTPTGQAPPSLASTPEQVHNIT